MNIYTLEKRQLINLGDYSGKIECVKGKIWITQIGSEDIILDNSSIFIEKSKELIIQSLGNAKVTIN